MKLVLAETPAQAKLLTGILGEGWQIEPCYDVVRDLPADKLGIDVDADFHPAFVIARGKGNLVRRLRKSIRESDAVYAALPPGRAGEVMAWHVLALSPDTKDKPVYRVSLLTLTPEAIHAAFASPQPLNVNWIDAELTCQIVDHLVGYGLHAAASKALGRHAVLGYDGMIALGLLVERERAVAAFTPTSSWTASVEFADNGTSFQAQVLNTKGAPLTMRSTEQGAQLQALLKTAVFWVNRVRQETKASHALDAFTTTALIEAVGSELEVSPRRTLALAEILYEAGWITHPFANSAALPSEIVEPIRAYIAREYGSDYVSPERQESGITPTDVNRVPEDLPGHGAALYTLIWLHAIAAQMAPTLHRVAAARILAGSSSGNPYPLELQVAGSTLDFDGWQRILGSDEVDAPLPVLTDGLRLQAPHIHIHPLTTEPPRRFSEHTLVKALSEVGISSTAAVQAVEQVQAAGYAATENSAFVLTTRGHELVDYLSTAFGDLTSMGYRAELATQIERIAAGEQSRINVLQTFWTRFGGLLQIPEVSVAKPAVGEHKPVVLRPAQEA